jgi:heme exporter protein C
MWRYFYQFSSPKIFYERMQRFIPWLAWAAALCLVVGVIWGLCFAPSDVQQKDAFRILYIHVPAAFLSMGLYSFMGVLSLIYLIWRIKLAGFLIKMVAEIGCLMTLLALITGSIWGKPMWGTWWIWDARLTSELILFMLYAAILAVHHAYPEGEQADKLIALLVIVGLVDLPIIHYSVVWWNTLHQAQTFSFFSKSHMDASMLPPLIWMLLGFSFYSSAMILTRAKDALLWRERRQKWVKSLIEVSK